MRGAIMILYRHAVGLLIVVLLLPGCWQSDTSPRTCIVSEYFTTESNTDLNVDSVAVWHGSLGQHWLLATAKTANAVLIYDAATGALLTTLGSPGTAIGQFERPNGIAVQDDFLFIVERDNKRLQIFHLPSMKPVGMMSGDLQRPYGITVYAVAKNKNYRVYVTDNDGPRRGVEPKKVYLYEASYDGGNMHIRLLKAFGDQEGTGALLKVESIAVDPQHNRLFVADEHTSRKNVKIYTLDGLFTGQTIGDGLIKSEPEGIALYEADDGGYVVVTDQDRKNNLFWIFDRITLKPLRAFMGEHTRNTDGIAITNKSFGPFKAGALYAVHDDGSIHAYDWQQLMQKCHID